jgi:hypothetical protein
MGHATPPHNQLRSKLKGAVQYFWETRHQQGEAQGAIKGVKDQGSRTNVTGGAHLNGFAKVLTELLIRIGVPDSAIFRKPERSALTLPGFYRPCKDWDLLVIMDCQLLVVVELKSQVGSFGNNYNNRTEEALGNATDFGGAYKHGVIPTIQPRPWLGYFMLLEDSPRSRQAVNRLPEPHFKILPEFRGASYAERYEILCTKLLQDRLYDGACLLMSPQESGRRIGDYSEPAPSLAFSKFIAAMTGHVQGFLASQ